MACGASDPEDPPLRRLHRGPHEVQRQRERRAARAGSRGHQRPRDDCRQPALHGWIRFGEANAHFGVTPQQVGLYRTNVSNGDTIRFTNARVAAESQRDAEIIQPARAAAGDGVDVAPLDESFPKSRGLPSYGNISIVQVVDQRFPWIYNEDGDIGFNFHDYTTGIANGIERACVTCRPIPHSPPAIGLALAPGHPDAEPKEPALAPTTRSPP